MNDEDRKRLTEWLGEEYHDYKISESGKSLSLCSCGLKGFSVREVCAKENRTFKTPDDMMACKDRLVELGIIEHFDAFIYIKWHEWFEGDEGQFIYFWEWLMEPDRFCQLCADFLKEGECLDHEEVEQKKGGHN